MPNEPKESDILDLVSPDDLFKAVLNAYSGSEAQYTGLLADPMQSSVYRIGQPQTKWTPTEEQLFAIVDASPLLTLIHTHRQTQVLRLSGWQHDNDKLGWNIVHMNHNSKDLEEPEDAPAKVNYLREIFERPYHLSIVGNTFGGFTNQNVEFNLAVDKQPIEILRKGKRGRGMVIYDPRTIRPVWELVWEYKKNHKDFDFYAGNWSEALERLSEDHKATTGGADLTKCSWVQYHQGKLTAAWTDDEMIVGTSFPSARMERRGFGIGRTERAIMALNAWIDAWGYNAEQFKTGISMVKGILAAIGSYSDENLKSLKKNLLAQITKRPGTIFPIIGIPNEKGLQWIRFDPTNREMDFMMWLDYCSSMVCGIYSIDPQEIGLASRAQAFSGALINNQGAEAQIAKKDHGYQSLLLEIKHIYDRVISKIGPEFKDYRFEWTGIDKIVTEQERISVLNQKTYLTINEKRIQENEEPLDIVVPLLGTEINFADVPERLIDPLLRAIQQAQQAKMQDAMMMRQGGEAGGGEEEEEGNDELPEGEDQEEESDQEVEDREQEPGSEEEEDQEFEKVEKAMVKGLFPDTIKIKITKRGS